MIWKGIIDRYRECLPVTRATNPVTLYEGNTPLLPAENLAKILKTDVKIYLKYEGMNPTGSFKDRGMTLAVTKAVEEKATSIMCASTGNTSASAAAYAAKAGLDCYVVLPKGAIAMGKLAQALIYGAKVIAIEGNFDDALNIVKEITSKHPIVLVNSLNPYRIEGQKTGAFEVIEQLGEITPDFHIMPVGNAGNITAYWKGYKEHFRRRKIGSLPKMIGFQAEGSAPIVKKKIITNPKTIATAIKIGNPASWKTAEEARDESGGLIDLVSDKEILEAYKLLASSEGVFAEPASCASIAGLVKLFRKGYFERTSGANTKTKLKVLKVVCVLTGHGLKDPDCVIKNIKPPIVVKPQMEAVLKAIGK